MKVIIMPADGSHAAATLKIRPRRGLKCLHCQKVDLVIFMVHMKELGCKKGVYRISGRSMKKQREVRRYEQE